MSSHLKAELAATCSTLGRLHKGEYLIEPECIESVKDLIRYLKRDNETHEIRRYLGESKVLQNDLIHVIKSCPDGNTELFDVTLRLLINLTTPTMLFYGEDVPVEKTARNIYLSLVGYSQDYKIAFCDVEFWNKICGKLTDLFETDWAERSADDGIQIERILMLLRNVLQVPADEESEKRPENDITIHDKVLWALRQSQILELLLFISSNTNEEQYYLNLLEIFSLILREHNPKLLAQCDIQRSAAEKNKDTEDLIRVRNSEKKDRNKYLNLRNFNPTFVLKGVKSLSNNDVVSHKSLEKVNDLDLNNSNKKQVRARRNRIPVESERVERRSSFSVRLFLKEFCLEFLNCSFRHLMSVVKNKLDSGKSLANDQTYYFWGLKFFLDFATASNSDVDLIKDFLSSESFHFVQMSMDNAFELLMADKKKTVEWVKRIHLILKAYHSLLETLLWMDCSRNPLTRSMSREIKSQIFYVVEYREMTLHILLKYDPTKFSLSYLRDLIETTHLFVKLLEEYSKQTKLVVQKITKKRSSKKKGKKAEPVVETKEEKWEKIKDDVYDTLCSESVFPEIPPFDAALEIPIDDQKGLAMKKIQTLLHHGKLKEGIGFLRSARQVWPENDFFGAEGMSVEDETMALQEICLADLGEVEGDVEKLADPEQEEKEEEEEEEEESDDLEDESRKQIVEQDFDIMDYKKRLVNKKVIEGCGLLLSNYKKNSDHTNHCVIKLLHRIGWECCMPAMLFQASIFWTLLKVMRDKSRDYGEINTFAVNLLRKFRKYASKNPIVFLELLFWKEHNVALEIQHGYQPYEEKPKQGRASKKKKPNDGNEVGRRRRKNKKNMEETDELNVDVDDQNASNGKMRKNSKEKTKLRKRKSKKEAEKAVEQALNEDGAEDDEQLPTPKGAEDVSRVLFDNSESDNESFLKESSNRKSSDGEDQSSGGENRISKIRKSHVKNKGNWSAVIDSSDEEGEGNGSEAQPNDKSTKKKSVREEPKFRRTFIDSGDSEAEGETNNTLKGKESDVVESEGQLRDVTVHSRLSGGSNYEKVEIQEEYQTQRFNQGTVETAPEDASQGKDSDHSSNSQKSSASSKKRARSDRKGFSSDDSDIESDIAKLKRPRFIGSDSDVDNFEESGEEEVISGSNWRRRRRRRLAVIDSDSDVETNSLDEK